MLTVFIMGIAWFTVGALGKAAPGTVEREVQTGKTLSAAKQALLAYVAQHAARDTTTVPGQLPCPESLLLTNPGYASSSCGNGAVVGRLPWRTLGIDEMRDGYGEPLWYALSAGFREAPVNFSSVGQLSYNGAANAAVAVIIAPGPALNAGGCNTTNQLAVANRYTAPLVPANFLECGNASGSYADATSTWNNDRVITITAAEWADAIAPAVADRLQREVAVALRNWDALEFAATGRSWGVTHGLEYLPYASDWGNPTTTDYCGNQDTLSGLIPLDPTCYNNGWSVDNVSTGGLLDIWGFGNGCSDLGDRLRCRFIRVLGLGSASAQITLSASNVARAFRSTLRPQDLNISTFGSASISMALSRSTSDATMTVNLTWPANLLLLSLGQVVSVEIPHLQSAQVLSDPRVTWFWTNQWQRYTYYGIGAGAAVNPPWSSRCNGPGDPGCMTVNNLPASTGNTNDKQLVLVLSGRPIGAQTHPSASVASYFEAQNASVGIIYEVGTVSASFNDRVAACPFEHTPASGTPITLC